MITETLKIFALFKTSFFTRLKSGVENAWKYCFVYIKQLGANGSSLLLPLLYRSLWAFNKHFKIFFQDILMKHLELIIVQKHFSHILQVLNTKNGLNSNRTKKLWRLSYPLYLSPTKFQSFLLEGAGNDQRASIMIVWDYIFSYRISNKCSYTK